MRKHLNEIKEFIRKTFKAPNSFIPLHEPRLVGNEKKYLIDTIDSTFVSSVGKYVDEFEQKIVDYTGAKYAVATVNGTSALHISLLLAGVKPGEEVITQALTFIATGNAISYCQASPVFIDVDKETLGLSTLKVEAFLKEHTEIREGKLFNKISNKRIAAVMPMHTFGHPCDIENLVKLCNQYQIPVVEDAAESLGSFYKGKHTGTFGLISAISFNGNKTITAGGGGVIITNDENLAKQAKHLTTTAKIPHKWEFVHDSIGYNYRMPNVNAALACAQLEQLEDFLKRKRLLAKEYQNFFAKLNILFIQEPNNSNSNYWLNALLLKNKEEREMFLEELNGSGIMARPIWALLYKMPMFEKCYRDDQTNAEYIEDRIINIPSSVIL